MANIIQSEAVKRASDAQNTSHLGKKKTKEKASNKENKGSFVDIHK